MPTLDGTVIKILVIQIILDIVRGWKGNVHGTALAPIYCVRHNYVNVVLLWCYIMIIWL